MHLRGGDRGGGGALPGEETKNEGDMNKRREPGELMSGLNIC
jgi:hypothetical protein